MIPYLDLKAQYETIKPEIDAAIASVLNSCQFILGEEVEKFEAEFANYCGTQSAVGVNSGTSALHLALLAAGIGPGDEVITASFTFVATAAAILHVGARPIFVDIDPRTCAIDPSLVEAAITSQTKAIMPVHLYGNCVDMNSLLEIARRRGLILIEDAAQAHGAEYFGLRAGSMGDIACFSFYPGKNLGAYGEAGAIVTNNSEWVKIVRQLRDQGQTRKYEHELIGYNSRMEAIQGAVLRVKLRHLDRWNSARRAHAADYGTLLAGSGVRLMQETAGSKSVYHIFPVFHDRRDLLRAHLESVGIGTGIHYPIPVHLQSAYQELGYKVGDLPLTERAANETLSLPMFPELTSAAVEQVAAAIAEFDERRVNAAS